VLLDPKNRHFIRIEATIKMRIASICRKWFHVIRIGDLTDLTILGLLVHKLALTQHMNGVVV